MVRRKIEATNKLEKLIIKDPVVAPHETIYSIYMLKMFENICITIFFNYITVTTAVDTLNMSTMGMRASLLVYIATRRLILSN